MKQYRKCPYKFKSDLVRWANGFFGHNPKFQHMKKPQLYALWYNASEKFVDWCDLKHGQAFVDRDRENYPFYPMIRFISGECDGYICTSRKCFFEGKYDGNIRIVKDHEISIKWGIPAGSVQQGIKYFAKLYSKHKQGDRNE